MSASTATDLFQSGDLDGAIAALTAVVKSSPTDVQARARLAEMLCFTGEIDRADKMMEVVGKQDTDHAVGIALFRRVMRGAIQREQVFREGRAPEFIGEPNACLQAHLRALTALRADDMAGVRAALEEAEEVRPSVIGTAGETPFTDLRDLDDLTANVLEVIAASGTYYWVSFDRLVSLDFHAPERPRDLIWRRASIEIAEGPEGEVFIPALYMPPPGVETRSDHKLGRVTEWIGDEDAGPILGLGQRCWLVGETDHPIMDLGTLSLPTNAPAAPEA
ncbi:tetratricopeptide repeat protein [Roseospira marina]|uniref:Tetratricopeptide repeat protein n=1 Tax=Roseospira marina TaxID=140057 RepID=A0A5M6I8F9_9PROT|nr:type VI secretion system accessory protein TagJ [Roseospira marina]KAA5604540.1 tetratricopeptide repeat protein [Roseospira marina]MBB4315284.1 type VI secretion system protein ImpE [Roseospira marina]MBB5088283.1 type VI secretion system protein ImpE [Roseospira marina]